MLFTKMDAIETDDGSANEISSQETGTDTKLENKERSSIEGMDITSVKAEICTSKNTPIEETNQLSNIKKNQSNDSNLKKGESKDDGVSEIEIQNVTADDKNVDSVPDVPEDSLSLYGRSSRAKIKKELRCYDCSETFNTQATFDDHIQIHIEVDVNRCRTCKKSFHTKTGLLNHMRVHIASKKRIYKCFICEDIFETNNALKTHKSVHIGSTFTCNLAKKCHGKIFKNQLDYWYHELSHYKNPKPKCEECGVYINSGYMKAHILTHFDTRETCGICGVMYSKLEKHMKCHGHERKCVECGKVFKENGAIKQHMMLHTGVRKFQCLYCGKGFITSQQRDNHTMVHTGERPHVCDICGHRSRQKIDALRHRQTHNKQKTFECDYCKKKLYRKESLLAHIRKHTKSCLFNCPECNFTTATKQGLRIHITFKHVDARPYKCDLCSMAYKMNDHLKRHNMSKMHRNKAYGAAKSVHNAH